MPDNHQQFSAHDIQLISRLVNSDELEQWVSDLEEQGAYAEVAWLGAIANDLETRFRVSMAIAVASAHGQLRDFHITVPGDE